MEKSSIRFGTPQIQTVKSLLILVILAIGICCLRGERVLDSNPDFLVENWLALDGIPESSALSLAQTPDGYIWVGSWDGLLRFNGFSFTQVAPAAGLERLGGLIHRIATDQSGRLWVSSEGGMASCDKGVWHAINGTNSPARSFAEDTNGTMFFGTFDGQVFAIKDFQIQTIDPPEGLYRSGVFCEKDTRDGGVWLANRGFVGRRNGEHWKRIGPSGIEPVPLLAAPAREGGIWVLTKGKLRRYQADGTITSAPGPDVPDFREMMEDGAGTIWIASTTRGVTRWLPHGLSRKEQTITATNGLAQNSIWSLLADKEGNYWLGSSSGGLHRLSPRQFVNIGLAQGLPNNLVRSVTEMTPGRILAATEGGGMAEITNGTVASVRPAALGRAGLSCWSLLKDTAGRLWVGTSGGGLFVEENGKERQVPSSLGQNINSLMQDSRGRIWVGTDMGLGFVENGVVRALPTNAAALIDNANCMADDPRSGALWIGTSDHGLFRVADESFTQIDRVQGLPSDRITFLTIDSDGCAWAGVFAHGLACTRGQEVRLLGPEQGLPAQIVASMVNDGRGYDWMGTDRGIVRVSHEELHRVLQKAVPSAAFTLFDAHDGVGWGNCVDGHQPSALKDANGKLWFATMNGVVMADPSKLQVNTNPPRVMLERVAFTERSGRKQEMIPSFTNPISVPPGSVELEFHFAALSFTSPDKVRMSYVLDGGGFDTNWLDIGNRHELVFHSSLVPGDYRLRIKARNKDGVWSDTRAELAFTVQPFLWQTLWFRVLVLAGMLGGTGWTVWCVGLAKSNRKIERMEQERILGRERARLASVLETTSDFVGFSTPDGQVLFINRAGRRMLGIGEAEDVQGIKDVDHYPAWAEMLVRGTGLPSAIRQGTWSGEVALKHRDGHEIPVSQVIVAHRAPDGSLDFISTIARDISGQKQAVNALRESEERFRQLTQAAFEGICVSENGRIVDINDQVLKMFGYTREELMGKAIVDLVAPESRAIVAEAISIGREGVYEHQVLRKDGSTFFAEAQAKTARVGQRTLRMTALRDITERKRAEEALREASQFNRQIIGGAQEGIIVLDRDLRYQVWNPFMERLTGVSSEKVLGRRVVEVFPFLQEVGVVASLERGLAGEIVEPIDFQFQIQETDRKGWSSETIAPLRNTKGEIIGVVVSVRDVTQRKRMDMLANGHRKILEMIAEDAALKETLDALAGVVESQVEGMLCSVLLLDADGIRLRHISAPSLPETYTEALDGKPIGPSAGSCGTAAFRRKPVFVEDIASDPLWENYKAIALSHGLRACWSTPIFDARHDIVGTFAVYYRHTRLPEEWEVELMDTASHTAAIAIGRQRAKAALQVTEEQLRQAQKLESIGQLAGGVAHDFNNILSSLIMQSELVEMVENLPGEARQGLLQIRADAQRAAELTRQLLLFSRRQVMQPRALDLNEIVMNLSRMLKRIIGEDVELDLRLHPAPLSIRADAGMIEQVLMNLSVNARDAMPGGGRLLIRTGLVTVPNDAKTLSPDAVPGNYVCFSVTDTGTGIPQELLPRIFEPFFTTKDVGKGTGLGLATVFGIVKQHQGWIKVDNRPGQGVTFQVFIPAGTTTAVDAATPDPRPRPRGGSETILLVEDDSALRKLTRTLLMRHGYTVLEAPDGIQALKVWEQHREAVALLLTDLVMPGGLGGQELARQLQADQPQLKVVFTSGYSAETGGHELKLRSGERFLQKPCAPDQLLLAIRQCLETSP